MVTAFALLAALRKLGFAMILLDGAQGLERVVLRHWVGWLLLLRLRLRDCFRRLVVGDRYVA
jgi:hypothetical protein